MQNLQGFEISPVVGLAGKLLPHSPSLPPAGKAMLPPSVRQQAQSSLHTYQPLY